MELYIYSRAMVLLGVIDEITSLIWTRRYWSAGDFKLLVPFTDRHAALISKGNLIMRRGDDEAAEIRYINIRRDAQGVEEIEVQGKFISGWIGKRIICGQIAAQDTTQSIIRRIVKETVVAPSDPARRIPNVLLESEEEDTGSGMIDYTSEAFANALLAVEAAAKAAKLGFKMRTDARAGKHYFTVYAGRNLTAEQGVFSPCIFSPEFDNVTEQEFTNSIENLKSTAYVGGEETVPRVVTEVGDGSSGLDREEVFDNATDITKVYRDASDTEITRTDAEYLECLQERGYSELAQYAETLNFASRINPNANLEYRRDFDLGDRVTCLDRQWGIKINVRVTEVTETYQKNGKEIEITFGESLPTLIARIRKASR